MAGLQLRVTVAGPLTDDRPLSRLVPERHVALALQLVDEHPQVKGRRVRCQGHQPAQQANG